MTFDSLNISSSSKKRCHSVHLICVCSTCTLQMGYILKMVMNCCRCCCPSFNVSDKNRFYDLMDSYVNTSTVLYSCCILIFYYTLPISVCVFNIIFFFKKFFGGKEGCVCVCV